MELEIQIPYNYKEYDWEIPIVKAFYDNKELWLNLHRRAGKDLLCFCRFLLPSALKRPGTYHYIWPTLKQGRDSFWEGKDEEGRDILKHYIPEVMVLKKDNQDMKLLLKAIGGTSTIQVFGTNGGQFEALRGKPGNGAIFTEFAYQDPRGLEVVSPMLRKTKGWSVFASTPNGNNHFKDGYFRARNNPNSFAVTDTIRETYDHSHVPLIGEDEIEEERHKGKSEDYIQQEYFCSFTQGIEGTYLGRQIQIARDENRVCKVGYDEATSVYTAWDLGVASFMSIIFYQLIGNEIHIIDYYENTGYSFLHYAKFLKEKGYFYDKHFAPHDIMAREMGGTGEKAISRLEKAEEVGINFSILPLSSFENGVESARSVMSRCYFNEATCGDLLTHLEQWGRSFNQLLQAYTDEEKRDVHTHAGSAFRYLATAVTEATHRGNVNVNEQEALDYVKKHSNKWSGL